MLVRYPPAEWPEMCLENVHAFGAPFNLCVVRTPQGIGVQVTRDGERIYDAIDLSGEPHVVSM